MSIFKLRGNDLFRQISKNLLYAFKIASGYNVMPICWSMSADENENDVFDVLDAIEKEYGPLPADILVEMLNVDSLVFSKYLSAWYTKKK